MTPPLSPNTQAILLLTAPFLAGRGAAQSDLLSPGEYKCLARHLRDSKLQPSDLISNDAQKVLRACQHIVDENRLKKLLGRGLMLSVSLEHWQARALWVLSRADAGYPRRLKERLREDAPPVIYGCGDIELLERGGLAVIGSRHAGCDLTDYAMSVGRLAARANKAIVSGGAKGVDQAAMRGALEAGGDVCGVLADSLERTAMDSENRNPLLDCRLTLISPYDPGAGFNVGNAMRRNKLIYALADASLVVNSDFNKGGTWAGASEQLDRLKYVPVFIRSTGESSAGLDGLQKKGALPWPNPQDADSFEKAFKTAIPVRVPHWRDNPELFSDEGAAVAAKRPPAEADTVSRSGLQEPCATGRDGQPRPTASEEPRLATTKTAAAQTRQDTEPFLREASPADRLLAFVREEIVQLSSSTTKKSSEVASALDVSNTQASIWLKRLVSEEVLEKQKKPAGYIAKNAAQTRQDTEPFLPEASPADRLFAFVREEIVRLSSSTTKRSSEVASALDVSNTQANIWLKRLVGEGVLEKQKKPAGYIAGKKRLFE